MRNAATSTGQGRDCVVLHLISQDLAPVDVAELLLLAGGLNDVAEHEIERLRLEGLDLPDNLPDA